MGRADPRLRHGGIAALQGDDMAEAARHVVAKDLDADQLRDAETQAAEWMKKMKKQLK